MKEHKDFEENIPKEKMEILLNEIKTTKQQIKKYINIKTWWKNKNAFKTALNFF